MSTTVNSVSVSGSGSVPRGNADAARVSASQVGAKDLALAATPVRSWILLGVEGP